jgi:hypothetical protein
MHDSAPDRDLNRPPRFIAAAIYEPTGANGLLLLAVKPNTEKLSNRFWPRALVSVRPWLEDCSSKFR